MRMHRVQVVWLCLGLTLLNGAFATPSSVPFDEPFSFVGSTGGAYTGGAYTGGGTTGGGTTGGGTTGGGTVAGGTSSGSSKIGGSAIQSSSPSLPGSKGKVIGAICCVDDIIKGGFVNTGTGERVDSEFAPGCLIEIPLDPVQRLSAPSCGGCGGGGGGPGVPVKPNSGGGCGESCGGSSSPVASSTSVGGNLEGGAAQSFRPDDRSVWSSFGPGMFSVYDSRVYFFPSVEGGTSAVLYDGQSGMTVNMSDGVTGDPEDGTYTILQSPVAQSMVLRTASGAVTSSIANAASATLAVWGGSQQVFDVVNLRPGSSVPEYVGRLKTLQDANGHALNVSYRDALSEAAGGFSAQQLTDSPERRLQIHQVTDWQGDVTTFQYGATQVSGRWAVSSVQLPGNESVSYSYTNGLLSSWTAGGQTTPITYGQDATSQATTVQMLVSSGQTRTVHLTNDYMTLVQNGTTTVVNQPVGVVRMLVNPGNEAEYMLVPDPDQAGVVQVYGGAGKAAEIVLGQSVRFFKNGWDVALPSSIGISPHGELEESFSSITATSAQLYTGTIPTATDDTGRQYAYEYDSSGFMTKKTFVADGTFEQYSYNAQKKLTRLRDRQGNVTLFEYDSRGNVTKKTSGLKVVGGQDVAQPELTELRWDYYPTGHASAGMLKTEYSANWDGSSTDTHRTDYEYNVRGNVTRRLGPAAAPGAPRPETQWTYDAMDRVTSTTDSDGHTATKVYDAVGRQIATIFDDTTTEQTLYGTAANGQDKLVLKTKDRRNVVTSYTYDSSGRVTQVIVGSAFDANILDGQADDTPITDRNQKSITSYAYLQGTSLPVSVVRDGAVTNMTYDYRQRVIATKVYPYAGKMLESKKVYVDNKLFSEEDPYGRKKFYGYRASDGQLIRYVTGAYPSFTLADQAAVFALTRSTALNPDYTVKDAITDQNGRPETVIDERGTISMTIYDAAGRVTQQIAAFGTAVEAKTETVYDDAGNAIEIRSPRYFDSNDVNGYQKCKTIMTYDGAGRVLTRTEAPGTPETATESYTYDAEGRQVTRTDARGKVWTTIYASCCGHTVASKNPLGHGSITNQNAGGLTVHTAGIADVDSHTSLLNPTNNKTLQETTTKFNALGRSIASTVWLEPLGLVDVANPPIAGFGGVAGTQGLTTQTLYDADLTDNVGLETTTGITVTNPLGGTYTVTLAAAITKLGQPIAQGGAGITFAAGTPGSAVVTINAENEISFSISDAQGRSLISGIVARTSGAGTSSELRTWSCNVPDTIETINSKVYLTSLSVDALGNTTKSRSNGLGQTVQSVDQAGNISTVQYDAGGNAIISRDPNNVGHDCVYDALGRRTQCTDTVGSVTKTGYDKSGQQISATDAKNKTTYYVFDARGRRRRETDRLNYPTEWSYDAAGNLLNLKDAENQITSYGYNDAGQRVTEQYPDHVAGATIGTAGYGIITSGYDALGRRVSKQDQQGDVTNYNLDMSGRMLTRVYVGHASGPLAGQTNTDTFTYDRAGRMLSGTKGCYNNKVTFTYDDRGEQTQETLTTHGQTYNVGYVKNVLGQTTRLVYPDGSLVDRAYTNRGQLQAVNYTPLGGALSSVATFTYDRGDRETERNLGNGLTNTRNYFADDQIQSIATPTVETLTYTYDANKNPTSESRSGVMAPYSWTTGYDDEDRLVNWSRANGDSQTWNLSPVHDWDTTAINGVAQTRAHGPAHELLTMSGAQVTNSPRTLNYDTKGNMTTDDRGCGMTWDFDNMLQSFAANGVTDLKNATYGYDAFGRRISKAIAQNSGTSTTLFVQAGDQIICEYKLEETTDCQRRYIYGSYIDDLLTVVDSSGVDYFLHHNRQYNTYALSNRAGHPVEFEEYRGYGGATLVLPTGASLEVGDTVKCGVLYTARYLDLESRLYFFRSRMYNPHFGRFLQRDRDVYIDGTNSMTAYSVMWSGLDPSGRSSVPDVANELRKLVSSILSNRTGEYFVTEGKSCGKVCVDSDFGPCKITLIGGRLKPECIYILQRSRQLAVDSFIHLDNVCSHAKCVEDELWCECRKQQDIDLKHRSSVEHVQEFRQCRFKVVCPYKEYVKGKIGTCESTVNAGPIRPQPSEE